MKRKFKYVLVALLLSLSYLSARAQAPKIIYSPSNYNFTLNSSVGTITPANNGGSIPANAYSTVSTYTGTALTTGSANSTLANSTYNNPRGMTIDYSNNIIYVADAANDVIRKINVAANTVTTFAGQVGVPGSGNGTAGNLTTARFSSPYAITYDGSDNLYIADYANNLIRKIKISTNTVTTITSAVTIDGPVGIVYDATTSSVYVANFVRNNILKITNLSTTPTIAVFAGSATTAASGTTDATGTAARFNGPNGLGIDASGNIYLADQTNGEVRKITSAAVVSTIGTGFANTRSCDADLSGNVYVTDDSDQINIISSSGAVSVVAGTGGTGSTNGIGTVAKFNTCRGITVNKSTGDLYICDYGNQTIRKMIGTGYFIDATLSTGLSFSATTGAISGTPTIRFAVTTYTITAFNSAGSSSATITLGCGRTVNWTGNAAFPNISKWLYGGNWDTGTAPTAADNVQIGVSIYSKNNQPTISAPTAVNSITFGPFGSTNGAIFASSTLTVTGNTLTIADALTINANATVTVTGNGTSSLTMAPGSKIMVSGTKLSIATGSFTLQSDATGSASVGPVTTTDFITSGTTVNVERYVTGGSSVYRGYRLLSSPVYVTGTNFYNLDYIKASSLITGVSTANGFNKAGNPSLFLFREDIPPSNATYGAGNWPGVSKINGAPTYLLQLNSLATNYSLMPGSGFLFFFRGDNANNLANKYTSGTAAEAVTFSASGILNVGQITAKDWYTPASANLGYTNATANAAVRGFNLLGNPYPSNIDWDTYHSGGSTTAGIYGLNIDSTVYLLDPVSKNYGAYIAGNGQIGTNNATNVIPSGEGFFVRATNTNPKLMFNESAKTTTQVIGPNLMLGKPVASARLQYLRIKMLKDSISTDETMIRINGSASLSFINKVDALYKQGNGSVHLASFTTDNIDIAIKSVPLPKLQSESLALDVNANTNGIYKLTLRDIVAIPRLFDVWLMDAHKKDSLDMRQNITYSFYIDKADSSTFGNKRFNLVIRQNGAYGYRLVDFTANKLQDARQVLVLWKTENEENYTNFTVERSTDNGATFKVLGDIDAAGAGSYSFIDKSPVNGTNLYRLKQEDINNTINYSKILIIQYSNLSNGIVGHNLSIYPNPAISNINLAIASQNNTASAYNIRFMSSSGILVKEATSSQASWQGSVSNLQPGTYIIQVFDNKTQNLVGQNKFVKL